MFNQQEIELLLEALTALETSSKMSNSFGQLLALSLAKSEDQYNEIERKMTEREERNKEAQRMQALRILSLKGKLAEIAMEKSATPFTDVTTVS